PSVQYVEIRMDDAIAQAAVGSTRLTAFSCDGSSFNVLLVVPSNLAIGVLNTEWIMATPNFAAAAGITPDFTWDPNVTGNIPSCGMVCWGAPGLLPPAPNTWDPSVPDNYVDCVGYGGYTGPTKTSIHDMTKPSGTPTPLGPGTGTFSL